MGQDSVPWSVNRSSQENYYLQSPNFNGAQGDRQATATLQVCHFFKGGDLIVSFTANVRETNGQVFQIVVDGQVATGGDITTPQTTTKDLTIPLSPGNHWVEFVYEWTPTLSGLPSTDGIVKIFYVELPQLDPKFPTSTPTDKPSLKPSISPSAFPTSSPSASPSVSSIYVVNTMELMIC